MFLRVYRVYNSCRKVSVKNLHVYDFSFQADLVYLVKQLRDDRYGHELGTLNKTLEGCR